MLCVSMYAGKYDHIMCLDAYWQTRSHYSHILYRTSANSRLETLPKGDTVAVVQAPPDGDAEGAESGVLEGELNAVAVVLQLV